MHTECPRHTPATVSFTAAFVCAKPPAQPTNRQEIRSPRIAFTLNSSVQLRRHRVRFSAIVLEQQHPLAFLRLPIRDRRLELPRLRRLLRNPRPIVSPALGHALSAFNFPFAIHGHAHIHLHRPPHTCHSTGCN